MGLDCRPFSSIATYIAGASLIEVVHEELYNRNDILDLVKKKLLKAQETVKLYADIKWILHQLNICDFVYVKLRMYSQTSVTRKGSHKLTKHFFGPFKLIQHINDVTFKLEFPTKSRIHLVFHV